MEVVNTLALRALAEARAGHTAAAQGTLRQAEALAAGYVPAPLHTAVDMAESYAALRDPSQAVRWLTRYEPAGDLHFQLHLRCDPPLDPIARDPRFQSLLTRARDLSSGCQ